MIRRRLHADLWIAVAVSLVAFVYRFNTLGGSLGGFGNDQFGYLARARQIEAGEVPFRDFNDPGWFLTDYLSAAAQWLGGFNLRSEALLTLGMLSLGTAVTFLLARRATRSLAASLLGVIFLVAFDARPYNYPKIVLYAGGLALAWAYADKPASGRLVALGGFIGLAALFRHDHIIYLGVLALLTVALVHRRSVAEAVRAAAGLAATTAFVLAPFLLFLALNGGVGEYLRTAWVYVARDAERTSFSLPRLSLDPSRPLATFGRDRATPVRIHVEWALDAGEHRQSRESRYGLTNGEPREGTTWSYDLQDTSRANIESLVRDPLVVDTHGLDRRRFIVPPPPFRIQTQLDTTSNATAFLYYLLMALPVAGAVVLIRLWRCTEAVRVATSAAYMVPFFALSGLLNVGFLSRGSTIIRIADVGVTSAISIAWLVTVLFGSDARLLLSNGVARALMRGAGALMLLLALWCCNTLWQGWRHMEQAGFTSGPARVFEIAVERWQELGTYPPDLTEAPDQPRVLRIAAYLHECTAPADRVFVFGEHPELYYFSDRRFAGGHAWLLPLYYSGDPDEARIVARLASARVPIVVTEDRMFYEAEYKPVFERIDEYLGREYTEAGQIEHDGARPLRVLVRTGLKPTRWYEPLELPCFAGAR